jgi:hypothetical protein|nr:MAG TPA: hypothetical protein [Caudoviricetes sp.]
MIGYSLNMKVIRYKCMLTQIDSYIMALAYNASGIIIMECTISTLYYI